MPPRRRSAVPASLTAEDLAVLAAAVAEGRRATVYLREGTPSLGLPPGSSARVIAVEGQTVVVRPRGVDDELPYEADELRRTKNPPPAPAPSKSAALKKTAAKKTDATSAAQKKTAPAKKAPAKKVAAAPAPQASRTPVPRTPSAGPPKSVTVTLFGSPDNTWSVAVARGGRKPQRSREVPADAVESAVAGLGDTSAIEAVGSVLHVAREHARERVAALSRELDEARQALAALSDTDERRTPLT